MATHTQHDPMRTDIIMPQMGESVTEGTIVQWLKEIGDVVERDEAILEISTDKVDAEIPSPIAGRLAAIMVQPGETVPVGYTIATIETDATVPLDASTQTQVPPTSATPPISNNPPSGDASVETLRRQRSTPLVRRIACEHDIDIAHLSGTGISGRVTKRDIMTFIDAGGAAQPTPPALQATETASALLPQQSPRLVAPQTAHDGIPVYDGDHVETLSIMRAKIAEHMLHSRATSAHAHTVHEIDFGRVMALRHTHKDEYLARGARLTVTTFIVKAVIDALLRFPILNSALDGNQLITRKALNIGVAVALKTGLIVPVVKDADNLNLAGIGRSIEDLATRARTKKLKPDEVSGGTFTVTNPGALGSLFGIPIINQPQVAILGCGAIKKRLVIGDDDSMNICFIGTFCLSFDHRVVDGAVADHFMAAVRQGIEHFEL